MEIARCHGCHKEISSQIELGMGICTGCQRLLETDKGYAIMCWNCNSITSIQEIPRHLRDSLTENTIFSLKCKKCGGTEEESKSWITFSNFNPIPKTIEEYITESQQSRKTDQNKVIIIYDI